MKRQIFRVVAGIALAALSAMPNVASADAEVYSMYSYTNGFTSGMATEPTHATVSAASTTTFTANPPLGLEIRCWYKIKGDSSGIPLYALSGESYIGVEPAHGAEYAWALGLDDLPGGGNWYLLPSFVWLKYDLNYDLNGASGTVPRVKYIYTNEVVIASPPSWTGHTFLGWQGEADTFEAGRIVTGADLGATTSGVVSLTAQWKTNSYRIVFNQNGLPVEGSMADMVVPYETTTNLSALAFTRSGYTFVKWSRQPDGTGTSYSDGAQVSNLSPTDGDEIILYAIWRENSYNIEFNANGGAGSMAPMTVPFSVKTNLTANAFSRPGYSFKEWATVADGMGNTYADGAEVMGLSGSATVNLYAQWTQNIYEVTFKYKDSGGADVTEKSSVRGYEAAIAPDVSVVDTWRDNRFVGWRPEDFSHVVSNMTVVAQYEEVLYYVIRFNPGEGTGNMPDMVVPYETRTNLALCAFSRSGYSFKEWLSNYGGYDHRFGDGQSINKLVNGSNILLGFTAQWTQNVYQVTFDTNGGGAASFAFKSVTFDETYGGLPSATRTGYTFGGWYTAASGGDEVTSGTVVSTAGDHVLYAHWTPISYNVAFAANGGSGLEMPTERHSYDEKFNLPANAYTRTGYAFGSWTNTLGEVFSDCATVSNLTAVVDATSTLYAAWSPVRYVVHFRPNGGWGYEGEMPDGTATYDIGYVLPSNTFTRTGYLFDGWATNGIGAVVYGDGETVVNLADVQDAVVDLYAQWSPITYTVRFDSGGGTGYMPDMSNLVYNAVTNLPSCSFSKSARNFAGWKYDGGTLGDGVEFSKLTTENGGVVTLTAQWMSLDTELKNALDIIDTGSDAVDLAITASGWNIVDDEDGAVNGSCLRAVNSTADLFVTFPTNGTLTFRWKLYGSDLTYQASMFTVKEGTAKTFLSKNPSNYPSPDWQGEQFMIDITNAPVTVVWKLSVPSHYPPSDGEEVRACLDNFVWTPDIGGAEPTDADRPVIGPVSAASGAFSLSCESTGAFLYVLEASDTIAPANWTAIDSKETSAAGEQVSFSLAIDPAKPARFFKIVVKATGAGSGTGVE